MSALWRELVKFKGLYGCKRTNGKCRGYVKALRDLKLETAPRATRMIYGSMTLYRIDGHPGIWRRSKPNLIAPTSLQIRDEYQLFTVYLDAELTDFATAALTRIEGAT